MLHIGGKKGRGMGEADIPPMSAFLGARQMDMPLLRQQERQYERQAETSRLVTQDETEV